LHQTLLRFKLLGLLERLLKQLASSFRVTVHLGKGEGGKKSSAAEYRGRCASTNLAKGSQVE
jgi:hypothetical protein